MWGNRSTEDIVKLIQDDELSEDEDDDPQNKENRGRINLDIEKNEEKAPNEDIDKSERRLEGGASENRPNAPEENRRESVGFEETERRKTKLRNSSGRFIKFRKNGAIRKLRTRSESQISPAPLPNSLKPRSSSTSSGSQEKSTRRAVSVSSLSGSQSLALNRKRRRNSIFKRKKSIEKEKKTRVYDEATEELIHRPTVLVVDNTLTKSYVINDRIKAIPKFRFLVPKICTEARKGDIHGEWVRNTDNGTWPGIPKKKFSKSQNKSDFGRNELNEWLVQGVFECEGDPTKYKTFYEGWTCLSIALQDKTEIEETAPDMVEFMKTRARFTEAVKRIFEEQNREFNFEKISWNSPESPYWLYQDLSYFHSMLHKEQGLAPIWYQHAMKGNIRPPRFAYTPINVVQIDVFNMCRQRIENKTFNELIQLNGRRIGCYRNTETFDAQACENKEKCVCDRRYSLLHGNSNSYNGHRFSRNVRVLPDGRIDLKSFRSSDARIVYECSDRCGCSWKCPRRQVQRGQQKPLCIFHENKKGFGVRAATAFKAGEFVCEYTGMMRCLPEEEIVEEKCYYREALKPIPSKSAKIVKKDQKTVVTSAASAEEKEIEKDLGAEISEASYEADFKVLEHSLVISAKFVGNVARFINHSCNPNTRFIETYSRRFENDPLIPRISVYAVEDIELGQEITCNYYDMKDAASARDSTRCLCNTNPCMKYLPIGKM